MKWTEEKINYLKENVDNKSNKELATTCNVTENSLSHIFQRYKIKRKYRKSFYIKAITYKVNRKGCHVCTSHHISKDGYPMKYYKGTTQPMARYIYEQYYHKEIPKGYCIRHTCDNPACINPKHLILGTQADNVKDRVERNRTSKGTERPNNKLSEKQVKNIRKKLEQGITMNSIARKYNVSLGAISGIKHSRNWKWLK